MERPSPEWWQHLPGHGPVPPPLTANLRLPTHPDASWPPCTFLPTPASARGWPLPGSPAGWCPSAPGRTPQHPPTQLPKAPARHQPGRPPQEEEEEEKDGDGAALPCFAASQALGFNPASSPRSLQTGGAPVFRTEVCSFLHTGPSGSLITTPVPPTPTNSLGSGVHALPPSPPHGAAIPHPIPSVLPGPPTLAMSQTVTSGLRGTRSKECTLFLMLLAILQSPHPKSATTSEAGLGGGGSGGSERPFPLPSPPPRVPRSSGAALGLALPASDRSPPTQVADDAIHGVLWPAPHLLSEAAVVDLECFRVALEELCRFPAGGGVELLVDVPEPGRQQPLLHPRPQGRRPSRRCRIWAGQSRGT